MRAFLILLVIANMAYFAWREDWFAPAPVQVLESQQSQFRQAEQALTLLAELSDERRELMSTLAEARAARTQAAEQLQQVQQQAEAITGEIEDNAAELVEDRVRSAQVQQELLETLDSAVAGEPAVAGDAAVAGNDRGATPAAITPWCASTSIFADQAAAAAFAQGAAGLGAEVSTELREQPISSTWWVYLPAFASEADARAMLSELQGKGIDSYYMRNGDMAGGISLGVYSREESARIAQRQLVDQGYMPDIREVFRVEERPFVRLLLPDGALRDSAEWSSFTAAAGSVELTEIACEAIASENEFP